MADEWFLRTVLYIVACAWWWLCCPRTPGADIGQGLGHGGGNSAGVVHSALDHVAAHGRQRFNSSALGSTGGDSVETEDTEWCFHVAQCHENTVAHLSAMVGHVHRMSNLQAVLRITKAHLALTQACITEGELLPRRVTTCHVWGRGSGSKGRAIFLFYFLFSACILFRQAVLDCVGCCKHLVALTLSTPPPHPPNLQPRRVKRRHCTALRPSLVLACSWLGPPPSAAPIVWVPRSPPAAPSPPHPPQRVSVDGPMT
jgi:hypothetical protein